MNGKIPIERIVVKGSADPYIWLTIFCLAALVFLLGLAH